MTPVFQFRFVAASAGVALGLFVALLVFVELGRQLGYRRTKRAGSAPPPNAPIIDSSVYGLLALLIGFTFSGASVRFDHRRDLVAKEANAASTAWQRIDLLPQAHRPAVRHALRRYVDEVVTWYIASNTTDAMLHQPAAVEKAQDELWKLAAEACLAPGGDAARPLLVPALNELFDTVDDERMARRMHPPRVVWLMLGITALASALFAGYGFAGAPRNWLYITGFAASVSIATYVIVELEFPRLGFTRTSGIDRPLVDVRATLR